MNETIEKVDNFSEKMLKVAKVLTIMHKWLTPTANLTNLETSMLQWWAWMTKSSNIKTCREVVDDGVRWSWDLAKRSKMRPRACLTRRVTTPDVRTLAQINKPPIQVFFFRHYSPQEPTTKLSQCIEATKYKEKEKKKRRRKGGKQGRTEKDERLKMKK